ncbi:MAG: hypothetical protein U0Q11_27490 [Vicinamibacterales bacterium]
MSTKSAGELTSGPESLHGDTDWCQRCGLDDWLEIECRFLEFTHMALCERRRTVALRQLREKGTGPDLRR